MVLLCLSIHICPSFSSNLNQWTDFHKTWYEHHATKGHSTYVLFNFQSSLITTRKLYEILRLESE